MANVIQVPTYEQIEVLLSKLATNYSNLASVFYDVFYNTTPMDVTLQMYDTAGVLQTYTIPNRAKDMKNMLSGNGNPEGSVEAGLGVIYQDLTNGNLYIKGTSSGDEGWEELATEDYVGTFLRQGNGSPEGNYEATKGVLYIDLVNSVLYIKSTETGDTGWVLISASTSVLANRDLSNLTTVGESHFANSSLSNLSTAGNAIIDGKEEVANKKTVVNSSSTDIEYPSAKATYTFVTNSIENLANKSLSNLTPLGGLKFINWSRVKDGVLCTPNNVIYQPESSPDAVMIPQGTILLLAAGRGDEGDTGYLCYNNEIKEFLAPISGNISAGIVSGEGYIFYNKITNTVEGCQKSKFITSDSEPEPTEYQLWYKPADNWYRYVVQVEGTDTWTAAPMTFVGEFTTTADENIDTLTPYYPIELVSTRDITHTVVEIGGTTENWYRLYRDGWLEQGGYFTGSGPIQFVKSFNATHYTFVPSANVTSFTKAAGQVTVTVANSSVETDWLASGWAAAS